MVSKFDATGNGRSRQEEGIEENSMALMQEQARSYQIELFNFAKKKNTIVCLGTGTGKTFISVLLVKYLEHEVAGPWLEEDGDGTPTGKRTVFLAPSVPLVEQQCAVLAQHMTVKVASYVGSLNVDRWTSETWNKELQGTGVLVMTPEVCRMAIDHGFLPMENINLLVLDECHRATGDDPYVKVMEIYASTDPKLRPKILGLTASVVNAQTRVVDVAKKIKELEACLFSVAKTASHKIVQFGTKPTEIIVSYENHDPENILPIDEEKLSSFEDCADFKEFRKMIRALAKTYKSCGAFCAKKLLDFRDQELQKALRLPDCADGFKESAPEKFSMYEELHRFLGEDPSIHDVPPKMKRLLEIIKQFENTSLSAVVFVEERLVAYVLYIWMDQLSKMRDGEFSFISCSFIVGQTQTNYGRDINNESLKMNSKAQHKVMRDFRNGYYNLMFATSVIEEGMDVPACNLIVRFDPPKDVRSYTQSKGRARAKPSLYVLLSAANELKSMQAILDSFQETEQLVMNCCETDRAAPSALESAEILREDPDLPPYCFGNARIPAQRAVSLIYSYCQQFMRMKYPNVFPFFDVEEYGGDTPQAFVCTLTMPIVCPVKDKIASSGRPLGSKDKARMFVALEMCKRLHHCGELADNLLPRRMDLNLYRLGEKPEDVRPRADLKAGMLVNRTKRGEKKRYVVPRKRADILRLQEEGVDCDPRNSYHLYVIKTEVVAWASEQQNWRGEELFDPSKYSTWLAIVMRSETSKMENVPKFPIFTRSGEERVSFIYAGPVTLDERLKKLCATFNRYVFQVVLDIADELLEKVVGFSTPCIVPVEEIESRGSFRLNMSVLTSIKGPKPPCFNKFVCRDEDYDDAVVELLYHLDENAEDLSREAHSRTPEDVYRRFYVLKSRTFGEDGQSLTPLTTGYYPYNSYLSFAEYAFNKTLRYGPSRLLDENQPVLTVEHTQKRLRMLKPRFSRQQERRQQYDDDPGLRYLLPQCVAVHAIKASLWRKITSLPSIIHRLNRLLLAEEVRLQISSAWRLKPEESCSGLWPPMKYEDPRKEHINEMPLNEFDALVRSGDRSFDESKLRFTNMAQPDLKNCVGPSPCDIMKALTTKACDEGFDLERLELLGDSFLQIVATFAVLDRNPKKNISELNTRRQHEVNNNHLLFRAHDRQLTRVFEAQQFRAEYNFLPFGYRATPHERRLLQREFLSLLVDSFGYCGPYLSPALQDLRHCRDLRLLLDSFEESDKDSLEEGHVKLLESDDLPRRHKIPVRLIHDFKSKLGGDVVEALAGVYLEKCGPIGALRFFKWIGMDFGDTRSNNFLDAFKLDFSAAKKVTAAQLKQYNHLIEKVEKQTGYTFNSKGLVLQAITHHSYREHLLTDDNNKLAFVGEAVVDYLLTLYIYGLSSHLNPGQMTDLRCALINNQVTAHAIVRAELHTVLLYTNNRLFSAIKKYLGNVDDIGLRLNTVFDDCETDEAEEAEIPSPIARILQSVLGAVFIDSDKSFETVWRVLVKIMGYEISLFTRNVPISPVKELMKMFPGSAFSRPILVEEGPDEGKFAVKLFVQRNSRIEEYLQIADTKKIARSILAKRYLRKLEAERKSREIEERKKAHVTDGSVSTLSDVLLESEIVKCKYYRKKN